MRTVDSDRAREVHNNFYSYDKVKFVSTHDDVIITCPVHGDFPQRPSHHLDGRGCPECSNDSFRKTLDEFIKEAQEIHGYKYDYSKVEYINNKTKIIIICPEHGEFPQTPAKHLYSKQGCPKCNESHLEKEIRVLIEEYNIEYIYNGRQTQHPWLEGLELDFYIPEINLAIECLGEQHFMPMTFSDNSVSDEEKQIDFNNILERDERKRVLCKENDVELIYYSDLDIEYPYEVFTDKNKVMDYIKTNSRNITNHYI